jgi:hypothetical protein
MPSGSQPGERRGGRKKGTPNKSTLAKQLALNALKPDGTDPESFFQSILENKEAPYEERKYAASMLFPYRKPKLANIDGRQSNATHEQKLAKLLEMAEDLNRGVDETEENGGAGKGTTQH